MGTSIMYARELKHKEFDAFYGLLLKYMTEKGFVDQEFNREMLNVEAKRIVSAMDHEVIALFHQDEMCGFAIMMFGQNTFNTGRFVQMDLVHIAPHLRDIDSISILFDKVYEIAQTNDYNEVFVSRKNCSFTESEAQEFFHSDSYFETDQIWKATI